MTAKTCSDADFIRLFEAHGAAGTAKRLGLGERGVYQRRNRLEKTIGRQLTGPDHHAQTRAGISHPHRVEVCVPDGVVLVGSDGHYWPGPASTAHRAFVRFCRDLEPAIVVMNGDVIDGSTISRHPPIGWEKRPSLVEEIEAAQERLHEIRLAAPKKCRTIWTLGNHDARFETRLATVAPEYAKVNGIHLKDHFGEEWEPAWSTWINSDVAIKHRFRGGIHATHNNVIWAGKTIVTGHLHSLKVTPMADYSGTRFGVDTGTLADPDGPQFRYLEDNPVNWRSGFIVLTFCAGRLLWPEIAHVLAPGRIEFRGKIMEV